jgi:NAD(P)-dependent dehydrogenase (short-subunit alcohol dehydrogenase family)
MQDALRQQMAAGLPRLRGRLMRAWQGHGAGRPVIRHALAGALSGDPGVDRAVVQGMPALQLLSLAELAVGSADPGVAGVEYPCFPVCFFDPQAGLILAAGSSGDMQAWLQRFGVRPGAAAPFRATAAQDPHGANGVAGKIVAVTGAASGIGLEIARTFAGAGASVVGLDVNAQGLEALVEQVECLALECDVTRQDSVDTAFARMAAECGGLDILVCNAGSASQAPIADVSICDLQHSFDLNFFGHQRVAQAAVRIFRLQGNGGLILFNISNQSVNPGKDFGPYGLAKAAELALMKQYALDHGHEGIRTNGVNAGRIRTGLMTDEMIQARATVRGISAHDYMAGNLLGVEVTARDVAEAFLHLALMEKVNAAVLTIDGGAMATSMR